MISIVTHENTGTVHAVTPWEAAGNGGRYIATACGRIAPGKLGTASVYQVAVTCGHCRAKPLHLPMYRAVNVGDRMYVDGRHPVTVTRVLRDRQLAMVRPDLSTEEVRCDLSRLSRETVDHA